MRSWLVTALLTLGVIGPRVAAADMSDLNALLKSVADEARVTTPLRADGDLTVSSPDGTHRHQVILLYRPGKSGSDLYIEARNDGTKVLILSDGAQAFLLKKGESKPQPFPPDATLLGSEFSREDLEPFHTSNIKDARISDENPPRMTVSIVSKPSQYVLEVATLDTERKVPLKTLYYRDTVNNLVKMERDQDYVAVGRKWLPQTITIEDFKLRTVSTLKLKWTQAPTFPPELFDPEFLPRPSALSWPAKAP
jgi:Outer membrane lipoprotein-sorting protein